MNMRRFFVGLLLPLMSIVAIIGSGFAVWSFKTEDVTVVSSDVEVAQLAKMGTFEQAETSTLILDQSEERSSLGIGIYLEFDSREEEANRVQYVDATNPLAPSIYEPKLSTLIFIRKEVSRYIRVVDGASPVLNYDKDYAVDEESSYSASDYRSYIVGWPEGEKEIALPSKGNQDASLFRFEYVPGMEPESEGEYGAMVDCVTRYGANAIAMVSEVRLGKVRG